jgi:hypothetical protein
MTQAGIGTAGFRHVFGILKYYLSAIAPRYPQTESVPIKRVYANHRLHNHNSSVSRNHHLARGVSEADATHSRSPRSPQ